MNIKEVLNDKNIDFSGIPLPYFLIGLLSAFENRFQAMADKTMKEISWKQFFAIIIYNIFIKQKFIIIKEEKLFVLTCAKSLQQSTNWPKLWEVLIKM